MAAPFRHEAGRRSPALTQIAMFGDVAVAIIAGAVAHRHPQGDGHERKLTPHLIGLSPPGAADPLLLPSLRGSPPNAALSWRGKKTGLPGLFSAY